MPITHPGFICISNNFSDISIPVGLTPRCTFCHTVVEQQLPEWAKFHKMIAAVFISFHLILATLTKPLFPFNNTIIQKGIKTTSQYIIIITIINAFMLQRHVIRCKMIAYQSRINIVGNLCGAYPFQSWPYLINVPQLMCNGPGSTCFCLLRIC
ncbi:hypothetical protein D3C73_498580 [compost metagenome]